MNAKNCVCGAALVQRRGDVMEETPQPLVKLRGPAVTDKQPQTTDRVQAFLDDYDAIKRVARYGL